MKYAALITIISTILASFFARAVEPAFNTFSEVTKSKPNEQNISNSKQQRPSSESIPISIEADSAEQIEKLGLTIYQGNVSVIQGNLAITADSVKIISSKPNATEKRQIDKIMATGEPATFAHNTALATDRLSAKANIIHYLPHSGKVRLEQQALLIQRGTSVKGDQIEYFIEEKKVVAAADPEQNTQRVRTVITPGEEFVFETPAP